MNLRKLAVATSTAAALMGLGYAPLSHAEPGVEPAPPCLAAGTCSLLTTDSPVGYLPLTPASKAQQAPLNPAGTAP